MLREKPNYAIDDVTVSIKETLQYYLPKFNERDFLKRAREPRGYKRVNSDFGVI